MATDTGRMLPPDSKHYPISLSPHEQAKYTKTFAKVGTDDGYLSGKRAAKLLSKSGLPQEQLARIWALSDQDSDGMLSVTEFCVAMHLVHCLKRGLPLPALDSGAAPKKRKKRIITNSETPTPGEEPDASDNQPLAETVTEMTPPRSPKRASRMASLLDDTQQLERRKSEQDTSATRGSSREKQERGETSSSGQDGTKYAEMFAKMDTEDGYLSGKRAGGLLRKSGLPREVLARVWALSDEDSDGRLSFEEFCRAMHLVRCAKRGLPLPEPIPGSARKESKSYNSEEAPGTEQTEQNAHPIAHIDAAQATPTSRITSILGNNQPLQTGLPESGADVEEPGREHRNAEGDYDKHYVCQISQHMDTMFNPDEGTQLSTSVDGHGNYGDASNRAYPTIFDDNIIVPEHQSDVRTDDSKTSNYKGGNSDNRGLTRQPRPKLRQLKASDVDAICADSEGAINSLRDVQSSRVLIRGLERLSSKDFARRVPVVIPRRRRNTLPLALHGEIALKTKFLPGRGRRTSLLLTAYEPAATFLRQRVNQRSTREAELERVAATAVEKWGLKVFPAYFQSDGRAVSSNEEVDAAMGDLNVAGLPLLDEDVDVIVHLLRYNHAFRRLDLSRCFLSDSHIVALAQALAWNGRVEQLCMRECTFTEVGTLALADVLMVNKRITSLDIRDSRGLEDKGMQELLSATNNSNLLMINGMKLASLRAEGSDVLDLRGWGLGYVECMVTAHCMRDRADGLRRVDLSNNSISTKAFTALMVALRKQTQLRSLDLSCNQVDKRSLPDVGDLLQRNAKLVDVNLAGNRISCSEFEHVGLYLMRLLSSNNTVTVFNIEDNDVTPKIMTIVAEKLAANRAVRRDMTFVDCLRLKYPRTAPNPVVADPRKLHLDNVDAFYMRQEGIPSIVTTVRTEQRTVWTTYGPKPGEPLDLFFMCKTAIDGMEIHVEPG